MRNRPTWIEYYMGMAFLVSQRSHDSETQHGCVITTKDNRVLSCGYNGFPRNIDDSALPDTRPEKYPWCLHSERNALSNCKADFNDAIAYVTGQCCNECLFALWQAGVSTIYMYDGHGSKLLNEDTQQVFDKFLELAAPKGLKVYKVAPNLGWIFKPTAFYQLVTETKIEELTNQKKKQAKSFRRINRA